MQKCTLSTHTRKSWVECSPGIFKFYTCRITPLHVYYLLMYSKYQVSVFAQKNGNFGSHCCLGAGGWSRVNEREEGKDSGQISRA